jgi:transcriptional regulator with XRE-family HTH domain
MENTFYLCDNDDMGKDTIGSLIRRHRRAAGLTQKELGDEIERTDRAISDWETGKGQPGRDSVSAMARFFNISTDEFLRRMDPDPELDVAIAGEYDRRHNDGYGAQRVRAAHIVERFIADQPDKLDSWLDYGEYLLDRNH